MKSLISKQELEELKEKYKGEERGLPFKSEALYILDREGEEGLRKLETAMADVGYKVDYREIKFTHFYPIMYEALTLVFIKRIFDYKEEDFFEIGEFALKIPSVIRTLLNIQRYLLRSPKNLLDRVASKIWKQYFMIGDLQIVEYDRDSHIVMRMVDYLHHPLQCAVIRGGLTSLFRLLIGKEKVVCKEQKCVHRGDEYHEYLIEW